MAAHHVYTQPVTDHFMANPMKYEQKILETIHWGVIDGRQRDVLKSECHIPSVPDMTDAIFDEMYVVQLECCKGQMNYLLFLI